MTQLLLPEKTKIVPNNNSNMANLINNKNYQTLINKISDIYQKGQNNAYQAINSQLIKTYWQIGKYIVEFEQDGNKRAEYGKELIDNLSGDLSLKYGKGFSRSNLIYMRLFFLNFQ